MNLFYKSPFDLKAKIISLSNQDLSIDNIKQLILNKENLLEDIVDINLYFNGKIFKNLSNINHENDIFLSVSLPIHGGKGGFGSMLRAIGAQIEKTTNREACRDLSGRRLRDVNEEKRIKEWIKKQAQRKEEEEKKKKEKLQRLAERTVSSTSQYVDTEFEKTRSEIPDIVEESITYGLKQTESSSKRKLDDADKDLSVSDNNVKKSCQQDINEGKVLKKQALWLGVDLSSDEDSDDEDDEKEVKEKQA